MSSTCVLVLGVPRSGTSCVAGVLHQLGCDMGAGHFQPTDKFNPKGYFEDLRWRYANQRITGKGYSLRAANVAHIGTVQKKTYRALARKRKDTPLWGIKDPWLCFLGQFIWPILLQEGFKVQIVVTQRERKASIASVQKHLQTTYKGRYKYDAKHIIDTWQAGLDRQLLAWEGPSYTVQYEHLVAKPLPEIRSLASFVFGSEFRNSFDAVARWVSGDLKHF